jgi:hypothetical protein
MKKTQIYIEYYYPGILTSERDSVQVESREAPKKLPDGCFGYRFFDRSETEDGGEILQGPPKNFSGMTYIGTMYTAEEYLKHPKCNKIARANIEGNNYKRLVVTKRGQLFPIEDADRVIDV